MKGLYCTAIATAAAAALVTGVAVRDKIMMEEISDQMYHTYDVVDQRMNKMEQTNLLLPYLKDFNNELMSRERAVKEAARQCQGVAHMAFVASHTAVTAAKNAESASVEFKGMMKKYLDGIEDAVHEMLSNHERKIGIAHVSSGNGAESELDDAADSDNDEVAAASENVDASVSGDDDPDGDPGSAGDGDNAPAGDAPAAAGAAAPNEAQRPRHQDS
jgi:hypothetical protein